MKVQFDLVIGKKKYVLTEEVSSHAEFFEKIHFYTDLPSVGPNGEMDLVLSYRTPKSYEYYSIVSEEAGMEFKFGQSKDRPGTLFAKGWEPLFKGDQEVVSNTVSGPSVGLGAPTNVTVKKSSPVKVANPVPTQVEMSSPEVVKNSNDILKKFGLKDQL